MLTSRSLPVIGLEWRFSEVWRPLEDARAPHCAPNQQTNPRALDVYPPPQAGCRRLGRRRRWTASWKRRGRSWRSGGKVSAAARGLRARLGAPARRPRRVRCSLGRARLLTLWTFPVRSCARAQKVDRAGYCPRRGREQDSAPGIPRQRQRQRPFPRRGCHPLQSPRGGCPGQSAFIAGRRRHSLGRS